MPLPSGFTLPSNTLLPGDGTPPDHRLVPTLEDIGALLHARTVLPGRAGEAGTFNEDTHPTGEQVQTLIDLATPGLLVQLPETVPEGLYGSIRLVVALTVAAMVERSYFPEQVAQGYSPAEGYELQASSALTALLAGAADNQVGGNRAYGVPIGTVVAASSLFSTDLLA